MQPRQPCSLTDLKLVSRNGGSQRAKMVARTIRVQDANCRPVPSRCIPKMGCDGQELAAMAWYSDGMVQRLSSQEGGGREGYPDSTANGCENLFWLFWLGCET